MSLAPGALPRCWSSRANPSSTVSGSSLCGRARTKVSMKVLAVSQVSRHIYKLLRTDRLLSDLWIRGEIANLSRSPAGHYYFSLRDASSQLKCVLFRAAAQRVGIAPAPGAAVILHG